MRLILLFIFTFSAPSILAQKDSTIIVSDSTMNWSVKGINTFLINQSSFSNWIGGGANNLGWRAGLDYNITYENGDNLWENVLVVNYGHNKTEGLGNRKTQDDLNFSTNYGRKISENWYISTGTSLQTQFAAGYQGGNDPEDEKISNFMAPGYINFGAGFTYRPDKNLTLTLRPANIRWTLVLDKDLQLKDNYGLKNDGDSSLLQFGFWTTVAYKLQLMENIYLVSNASIISNYLDHPERLVLIYGGKLNLRVNKYISTVFTLDFIYDHNQIQKLQTKQTIGVGLSYDLKKGKKKTENKFQRTWR